MVLSGILFVDMASAAFDPLPKQVSFIDGTDTKQTSSQGSDSPSAIKLLMKWRLF
jgi:hypothetical protein